MRKPEFCLCENKGADQLRGNMVCVGHVRKPHCWFSRDAAHILNKALYIIPSTNNFIKDLGLQ